MRGDQLWTAAAMTQTLSSDARAEYRRLISAKRFKASSNPKRSVAEEAASDRSRILYSSAFRRLQQKTQVFPLSKNAAVRSRLTHSLEVSDVGRLIARSLARSLLKSLGDDQREAMVLMVETGCLMHDIGNPPFGHFAEVAIQKWFQSYWYEHYRDSMGSEPVEKRTMENLSLDFFQFDGNPQGIRIVTRLQGRTKDDRLAYGMNLTYSQLLTGLKYLRAPAKPKPGSYAGKPGFFRSESDRVERARDALHVGEGQRFPLSYVAEAADDIAYCLSDIEDGIDTGTLDGLECFEVIRESLRKLSADWPERLRTTTETALASTIQPTRTWRDHFLVFKTELTPALIHRAARRYEERHDSILSGTLHTLFGEGDEETLLLDDLKKLAARRLYSSIRVEQPLRMGYQVMGGLLDRLGVLLRLSHSDFQALIDARDSGDRTEIKRRRQDPELLIFDLLPKAYLDTYSAERDVDRSSEWEWFCRAHLVLDYLSGMTDEFALRTYHAVAGIDYDI